MKRLTIAVSTIAALLVLPGAAVAKDGDGDKLPDGWEKRHGLSTTKASGRGDPDGDGLTNRQEFRCQTKPHSADSDGDKREDADEDPDRDRVDNGNEMLQRTRPFDRDSDDDGVRDGREDLDRDRLSNAGEDATSNDPTDPDTDDDGIKDGKERAGTIVSYEEGELTVELANGGRVSGLVTGGTEIECETEDDHEGSDDDDDRGKALAKDARDEDDPSEDSDDGEENDHDDGEVEEGEHGDDDEDDSTCGPADLQPGVAVHEAELRVSADGLIFEEIELVK
jgi:hypothetical protein